MKVIIPIPRLLISKAAFLAALLGLLISHSALAGPPIGVNLSYVADYAPDRLFADAFKESRDWLNIAGTAAAAADANGWPMEDAKLYAWAGLANAQGTYALSFTGQAMVAADGTLSNQSYDAATNTTTATLTVTTGDTNFMSFTNTRRTAASAVNTGITNVKLMRPLIPGATDTYSTTATFTDQIKAMVEKFSVIRFMDYLSTNANPQVDWSDRTLPSRFSQQRFQNGFFSSPAMGAALEYAVQLCNETNTAMWVNIPAKATDDYILNLARLIAFGSDGVTPYASAQANPVWAPLNPNLKVYVEYSNEVWNTAGPFRQSFDNHDAAVAEVNTGGSPLNFDGDTGDWDWAARRSAKRTVDISNIFRSVFGDSAMPADGTNVQNPEARIRPVLESQLGYAAFWHYQQMRMLQDYYNTTRVSTPRPPSYYIYGGGGSAYYGPDNGGSWDLDSVWTNSTFDDGTWANQINEDIGYDLPMFGRRIAYEGGPALDRAGAEVDSLKEQVWGDSRITAKVSGHQKIWNEQGGGLLMYFTAFGDYQWGFAHSVDDLNTPKLAGIDAVNVSSPISGTAGAAIPTAIDAVAVSGPNYPPSSGNLQALATDQPSWLGYLVHNNTTEVFKIGLTAGSTGAGNEADVYIDGGLIGTIAIPNTGSNNTRQATATVTTPILATGTHGLLIKAKMGAFGFGSILITDTSGGLLPSEPGTLTATASAGQVSLYWGTATNATSYNIYRGTSVHGEDVTPIATGVNATTFVDATVTNGTIYYYVIAGVNATGVGTFSNEITAAPDVPPPSHPGITSVRFFPRANWSARMIGGLFQGSNDNSTWTTIATVTNQPPDGIWTTLNVSNSTEWRYARYLSPDYGSCNVAEIEFYHDITKLTGTGFGSSGSYGNGSNTFDKAIDGSTDTYFDAADASDDFVGLDFGSTSTVAPAAPVNVTAVPGDQQVALSWTAGADATTYNIYRSTTAGDEGVTPFITAISSPNYTDTTLTNGILYYYRIAGVNAIGVGVQSAEVFAIPAAASNPGQGSHAVTSVRFYPRANWSQRMTGGLFQASNDNTTWTTLATITTQPPEATWTTLPVSNAALWRYVRYLSPAASFGDVAEVEFYEGTDRLTGPGFGTPGSWNDSGSTFDRALDGDTGTFFDNVEGDGNYVGLDLGAPTSNAAGIGPQVITSIKFYPRAPDAAWRMQGGRFEASNDNATWTTLVSLVDVWPADNAWTTLPVSDATAWRYVRFVSSSVDSWDALNVAELEFYHDTKKLIGTAFGSPGSYQNDPNLTFDKAFDGDIATYIDNVGGSFVGMDFGAGAPPSAGIGPQIITSIKFYPRAPDLAWRMQGGRFEASNDNTTWTTLVSLVDVWPADNAWTTLPVTVATAWRYVRFVSSAVDSWDALNIAELEFYHDTTKLVGTAFGSPGSYQNDPNLTFDKAFDGDIATYIDNVGGSFVGMDFGASSSAAIPVAPSGLTATADIEQISLTWTAAPGATSYSIFRGIIAGGESPTPIATAVSATSYSDAGLTNGTTYFYTVSGVNAGGVGPQSNEASATPMLPPVAPAITMQPLPQTKTVGDAISFTVIATGNPAPTYQWEKDGVAITGNSSAQTATLNFTAIDSGDAGSYRAVVTNPAGTAQSDSVTLTVLKASVVLTLSDLTQDYNGTPRNVLAATVPSGLPVTFTYNGGPTAPIYPGRYTVVATIADDNFTGTASATLIVSTTALVRHLELLNGAIDGSVQLLNDDSFALNGSDWISGDLLVSGTPDVKLKGHPQYAGTLNATGKPTPSNYSVTLNGSALLRHVVRRVDTIAMPVVNTPPKPTGARNVTIDRANQTPGDFATLRNLTVNANNLQIAIPAGTYGEFTVTGKSALVFGVAGAIEPSIYNLRGLALSRNAELKVVGPVVIHLPNGPIMDGLTMGSAQHPEWLELTFTSGWLTLSGRVTLSGNVTAPNSPVVILGNSTLIGHVVSEWLIIQGNGQLTDTAP